MIYLEITGDRAVQKLMATISDAAQEVASLDLQVGSSLPYAYGIETGYTRYGRLARRAGGAFMVARALEQMMPIVENRLAGTLLRGPSAARREVFSLANQTVQRIQAGTPVRSGNLRDSFQAVFNG